MLAVSVCYEYLSEILTGYHLNDILHAVGIEFVEDIVKEQ